MKTLKVLFGCMGVVGLFGWVFLAGAFVRASAAETINVDVLDNVFESNEVAIYVGDTVRWENKGFNEHNVASVDGQFPGSGEESAEPWVYEYTFEEAGYYEYVCEPHVDENMRGVIIVEERPEPTPTLPTAGYLPYVVRD